MQHRAGAGYAVVRDIGRFVDLVADAVADQFADNAKVVLFQHVLDGGGDVADPGAFAVTAAMPASRAALVPSSRRWTPAEPWPPAMTLTAESLIMPL